MNQHLPDFVAQILKRINDRGYEVYIVGGVVRDLILGAGSLPTNRKVDWDFTTNAAPEEIIKLFPDAFYDNKFGTVGVTEPGQEGLVYEITIFQTETSYSDRRHPDEVKWGKTLAEDLQRRDFTINAMALKVTKWQDNKQATLEIIDLYQGQEDLKKKVIRAVGKPEDRFSEDALRMLRAIRLASQLEFEIEEKTFEAIKNNAQLIDFVSWERIRDEIFKLLVSPAPAKAYQMLRESGLANKILPEVEAGFGIDQKSPGRHHVFDVGTHSVEALKYITSPDPVVRLATLIHDVGKVQTVKPLTSGTITFYNHEVVGARLAKNIARRLCLSKKDAEKLYRLVRWHLFTVDEKQTDKAVRRFIRNVGQDNLEAMLALRVADRLGSGAKTTSWRLERFKQQLVEVQKQAFSITDLKVNGNDVMKTLKIKPGPRVGEILQTLFKEVEEDDQKNTRAYLMQRMKQIFERL